MVSSRSRATRVGSAGGREEAGSAARSRSRSSGSRSQSVVHGLLPSLDSSCPARRLDLSQLARSFSRARCSRMLAAFGVMSRTARSRPASAAPRPTAAAARRPRAAAPPSPRLEPGSSPSHRVRRRLRAAGRRAAILAATRCWRRAPRSALARQLRATPYAHGSGSRRQLVAAAASRPAGSRRARRPRSRGRYGAPGTAAAARSAQARSPRSGPGGSARPRLHPHTRRPVARWHVGHADPSLVHARDTPTRRLLTPGDGSGSSRARSAGAPGSSAGSSAARG